MMYLATSTVTAATSSRPGVSKVQLQVVVKIVFFGYRTEVTGPVSWQRHLCRDNMQFALLTTSSCLVLAPPASALVTPAVSISHCTHPAAVPHENSVVFPGDTRAPAASLLLAKESDAITPDDEATADAKLRGRLIFGLIVANSVFWQYLRPTLRGEENALSKLPFPKQAKKARRKPRGGGDRLRMQLDGMQPLPSARRRLVCLAAAAACVASPFRSSASGNDSPFVLPAQRAARFLSEPNAGASDTGSILLASPARFDASTGRYTERFSATFTESSLGLDLRFERLELGPARIKVRDVKANSASFRAGIPPDYLYLTSVNDIRVSGQLSLKEVGTMVQSAPRPVTLTFDGKESEEEISEESLTRRLSKYREQRLESALASRTESPWTADAVDQYEEQVAKKLRFDSF